jgi:uncharacterized protein (TIGR00251 family)
MEKREFLSKKDDKIIMRLHVKPNSLKQKLVFDTTENQLTIFLKSPPDKGKANKELIKYISKYFEMSTAEISIISGHTSRDKILLLENKSIDFLKSKLIKNEK